MVTHWRTVQFFLEDYGVVEFEIDLIDNRKVRCNCPDFKVLSKCKHMQHAHNVMAGNNGHYSIDVPVDVDEDSAVLAIHESSLFRAFIIKYGKVLVLTNPTQVNIS